MSLASRALIRGLAALAMAATLMVPSGAGAFPSSPPHLNSFRAGSPPAGFHGVCSRYSWACSNRGGGAGSNALALAQSINAAVNREVKGVTDQQLYGKREYWTLPKGAGDCEDYALLKMKRLIDAGVPPSKLLLAVVVGATDSTHVVLVLRTGSGDYILDNLASRVARWQATRYTFIKMQNASNRGRWDVVLLGPRATRN